MLSVHVRNWPGLELSLGTRALLAPEKPRRLRLAKAEKESVLDEV